MRVKPRVAITAGDPAGIGPEIAARAAADARVRDVCEPVRVRSAVRNRARSRRACSAPTAGRAAYDTIVRAVGDARAGVVDAIATAPVNKEAFRLAGLPWSGHTDLLAHLTGARRVAMMFDSDGAARGAGDGAHPARRRSARALTQRVARGDDRSDGARAAAVRRRAAADRGRRAEPARRRARAVRARGGRRRSRRRSTACRGARHRRVGTVSGRYRVRARRAAASSTSVDRLLSRSGADPGEAAGVRPGGERHARPADRPDVGRSRHGVRHRRQGRRRSASSMIAAVLLAARLAERAT